VVSVIGVLFVVGACAGFVAEQAGIDGFAAARVAVVITGLVAALAVVIHQPTTQMWMWSK
jgi:hypothetical protein